MLPILATVVALQPHAANHLHRIAAREASLIKAHASIADLATPLVEAVKPSIPKQWRATYSEVETINGKVQTSIVPINSESVMYSDAAMKRSYTGSSLLFPFAPKSFAGTGKDYMNLSTVATDSYGGFIINGQTLDASAAYALKFRDLFSWVELAHDDGEVTLNGTTLHAWSLVVPSSNLSLYLLVDAHGAPRRFEENITVPPPSSFAGHLQLSYTFSEWTPGATWSGWSGVDPSAFTSPPRCAAPAGGRDPPPAVVPMFIFHPAAQFNITRQDLGDALGDTFFTCVDVITGQNTSVDHDYAWLSQWNVTLVPRWGQYQNCNSYGEQNTCLGAENFYVGHEAAQGLGLPAGGQCEINSETGEWWSLPAGGQCAAGTVPGGGQCTWSAQRVKTIDSACLFGQRGFSAACRSAGRAPFAEAAALFTRAFASDDPAKGGCPPISSPQPAVAAA